jgi:hypothetical protein
MLIIKVQAIINRKMPLGTRMEPTLFNILTLGVTTSRVIGNCNIRVSGKFWYSVSRYKINVKSIGNFC